MNNQQVIDALQKLTRAFDRDRAQVNDSIKKMANKVTELTVIINKNSASAKDNINRLTNDVDQLTNTIRKSSTYTIDVKINKYRQHIQSENNIERFMNLIKKKFGFGPTQPASQAQSEAMSLIPQSNENSSNKFSQRTSRQLQPSPFSEKKTE